MSGEIEEALKRVMRSKVRRIAALVKQQIIDNISLEDHSLEELRALGYPYSRENPQSLHSPEYLVHKQNGDLVKAIFIRPSADGLHMSIGVDITMAPHAAEIIFGTSKMVSRDFISGSLTEVQPQIDAIIKE